MGSSFFHFPTATHPSTKKKKRDTRRRDRNTRSNMVKKNPEQLVVKTEDPKRTKESDIGRQWSTLHTQKSDGEPVSNAPF